MFTYKLDCRLKPTLPQEETPSVALRLEHTHTSDCIDSGISQSTRIPPVNVVPERDVTRYPLIWIPKAKKLARKYEKDQHDQTDHRILKVGPAGELTPDSDEEISRKRREADENFLIDVQLDFGKWFTWLERGIWLTMFASIVWALALDTTKATNEVCLKDGKEHYPFNFLPSLSRTMGSFRIGTLFWTICMSSCFMARLMSNYFLHKLYENWYEPTIWNNIFLKTAYILDNLEIISLIMIPAYSLDCDWFAHRAAFIAYLALTYSAELLQYFTRFLRRKKGILLQMDDVSNYYRQIGILIILQTFFLLWMLAGFLLHENVCGDLHFTLFTLGEYFTVIVNVRFKRDTILFVR